VYRFQQFFIAKFGFQETEISHDNGEKIIEVVGYAAGKLANRLHFLGLAQGCLGLLVLGKVLAEYEEPQPPTLFVDMGYK
jgi:predicted porin